LVARLRVRRAPTHVIKIFSADARRGIVADRQPGLGVAALIEIVGRSGAAHAGRHPAGLQRIRQHAGPAPRHRKRQQHVVQLAFGIGL
jgi:hypothetical protein